MRVGHRRRAIMTAVALTAIAAVGPGCSGRRPPGESPVAPPPGGVPGGGVVGEPGAVERSGDVPGWAGRPDLHPMFPAPRYLGAVGTSFTGGAEAELMAVERLRMEIETRIDAARRRAEAVHPCYVEGGRLAAGIADDLDPGSRLMSEVRSEIRLDPESRVIADRVHYGFAYVDREAIDRLVAPRIERARGWVAEAAMFALESEEAGSWFGFSQWARSGLVHESEFVAALIVRNALGTPSTLAARHDSGYLEPIRVLADSMLVKHSFSLSTEFEWEGARPAPRVEPQIQQRVLDFLLRKGLKVGLGSGCPHPATDEEGEVVEPPPHYVLRLHTRGATQRTALSWTASIEMEVDAYICETGERTATEPLGVLLGEHVRDPAAAYFRALDWQLLEERMNETFDRMGILLPPELLPIVVGG